jgi:hypothetical protein
MLTYAIHKSDARGLDLFLAIGSDLDLSELGGGRSGSVVSAPGGWLRGR